MWNDTSDPTIVHGPKCRINLQYNGTWFETYTATTFWHSEIRNFGILLLLHNIISLVLCQSIVIGAVALVAAFHSSECIICPQRNSTTSFSSVGIICMLWDNVISNLKSKVLQKIHWSVLELQGLSILMRLCWEEMKWWSKMKNFINKMWRCPYLKKHSLLKSKNYIL